MANGYYRIDTNVSELAPNIFRSAYKLESSSTAATYI